MKRLFLAICCISLFGCGSLHQHYYAQVAPSKYAPTDTVYVFDYENLRLKEIYDLLFSDFLIIGKSSFYAPYNPTRRVVPFAKSIGADVVITSIQFKDTQTSVLPLTTPTTNVTNYSGNIGGKAVYGSATSFGTTTTMMPIQVDYYDQGAYFLRNVNHVKPLWERTSSDYPVTATDPMSGTWASEGYVLNVYVSSGNLVASIVQSFRPETPWMNGDIKFVFNKKSLTGVYLLGNKTPQPAMASINKFGHLEIKLVGSNQTFSFEKK